MGNKKLILILVISLTILGMGYIIYTMNQKLVKSSQKVQEMEQSLRTSDLRYYKITGSRDSLFKINMFLAKYRALTVAMTYRDSVRIPMNYKIGDAVRMKRDSSRVVISDIIVGGGKHEYYIKYKVMFKDGKEEEVVPELLY